MANEVEEIKIKKWNVKDVDVIYERVNEGNGVIFTDGSYLSGPASKITIFAQDADIKKALLSIFWLLVKQVGRIF